MVSEHEYGTGPHIYDDAVIEKNFNNSIYIAFIDVEKAFGSNLRSEVSNKLRRRRIVQFPT